MTLYQFKLLSPIEKMEVLFEYGVRIAKREDKDKHFALYSLGELYIEVESRIKEKDTLHFRPFYQGKILETYLAQVDISELSITLSSS